MGQWTIKMLGKLEPEKRLRAAAWLFWLSILAGAASVAFLAQGGYERVLMGISWGAITITCVDVVLTADVRENGEE